MAQGQLFTFLLEFRALDGILDSKNTPDYTITRNGVGEYLFDGIRDILNNAYQSSPDSGGLRDLWVFNNFNSEIPFNGNTAEIRITLDYDRVVQNKSSAISRIIRITEDALKTARHTPNSRTIRENIPEIPVFKLVTNEVQDEEKFGYKFNLFWGQPDDAGQLLEWEIGDPLPFEEEPTVEEPVEEPTPEPETVEDEPQEFDTEEEPEETPIPQDTEEDEEDDTEDPIGDPVLLEQIFAPTIKPTVIEIDTGGELTPGQANNIGISIQQAPFIYYNGLQINPGDITFFQLYHEDILPACKLIFTDTNGIFRGIGFPPDDTVITIYIDSKSENLRSVYMDFKITEFDDMEDDTISMLCIINVPGLYQKTNESFKDMTSLEAMKEIASLCGLGMCTNTDGTNDRMTWLSPAIFRYEFIKEITQHMYSGTTSFFKVYIDWYYNICVIDVEKELTRDNENDLMIQQTGIEKATGNDVREKTVPLLLTTDETAQNTNAFVVSPRITNSSTKVNLNNSYFTESISYTTDTKSFSNFTIDTRTNLSAASNALKDNTERDLYKKARWNGKTDDYSNNGNQHKEYGYSKILNEVNLRELSKLKIDLTLPNPNFNLYRYLKINFIMVLQKPSSNSGIIHTRITGNAIIDNIEFVFDGNRSYQKVFLIRRDISPLDQDETEDYVEETYSDNDNPIPEEDTPTPEAVEDTQLITEEETPTNVPEEPETTPEENNNVPTETSESENDEIDIERIKNAIIGLRWEGSDLQLFIRNFSISNDWGIRLSVINNNQKVDLETFPSSKWQIGEDSLTLTTSITKNLLSRIGKRTVWSRTLNNTTDRQVTIPFLSGFLTFYKNGAETQEINFFRYYTECKDRTDEDGYKRFDFIFDEYDAGLAACRCISWPKPDGSFYPPGSCPTDIYM